MKITRDLLPRPSYHSHIQSGPRLSRNDGMTDKGIVYIKPMILVDGHDCDFVRFTESQRRRRHLV